MKSKNKPPMTAAERAHVERVKELPCSVCGAPGPSEAHHVVQGDDFTTVALCQPCHTGPMGVHGDQTMLRLRFKVGGLPGELRAINETLQRLAP